MTSCDIPKRIASLLQKDDVSQYTNRNHESYRYGKGRLAIRRSNNDLLFASILQLTIGSILFLPLISLNATVCALTVRATGNNDAINSISSADDGYQPSYIPSHLFFPGEDDYDNKDASGEDVGQNMGDYNALENEPSGNIEELRSVKRAGMNTMYLRSGRAANMLLRAGKRSNLPNDNIQSDEDVDEEADEKIKRAQSMLLRTGKRSGSSMLLRAGRSPMLLRAGRSAMLLRAGRASGGNMLLRAGKRAAGTMYLRAGKRFDDTNLCLHMDCSLLALHAFQGDEISPKLKKSSANGMLLRAGKRAKGNMYLRAGKRSNADHDATKKAGSMYLRAGKRSLEPFSGKRAGLDMLLRNGK